MGRRDGWRWGSCESFLSPSPWPCSPSSSCKTSKCGHLTNQNGNRGGRGAGGVNTPSSAHPTPTPAPPRTLPNHQDSSKEDNHHHPSHHHDHQCAAEAEAEQGEQDDAEVLWGALATQATQHGSDWSQLGLVQHEGDGCLQELRGLLPRRLYQRHQALCHLPHSIKKKRGTFATTTTHLAATVPP